MATTYHQMTIGDYDEVMTLWQRTEGMGLGVSDSRENIAVFLARNDGLSRVARVDDRIIGALLCGYDGRRGYLHHLAVAVEHRRQGIARALVEECLTGLRALDISKCNIFVFGENTAAQQFWQHLGWAGRSDLLMMQVELVETARRGCEC